MLVHLGADCKSLPLDLEIIVEFFEKNFDLDPQDLNPSTAAFPLNLSRSS